MNRTEGWKMKNFAVKKIETNWHLGIPENCKRRF